jgi:hypothetical protein
MDYANRISIQTATILSGATLSDAMDSGSGLSDGRQQPIGLFIPAAFTGIAITFTACDTAGGTYVAVRDVGGATAYSVVVAASQYVPLEPRVFAGLQFVKLVSGTAEGADRSIKVVRRAVD